MSGKHTEVNEICSHCATSHSKKLLCHGERELLDIKKSCDFCGSRHSNLNNHFAEYAMVHLHDCLSKIYESDQRHICEEKVKSMVVKKDSGICSMCVEELFPNDRTRHEDVENVQCIELLHPDSKCTKYCHYCYRAGLLGILGEPVLELRDRSNHECLVLETTKKCIDDGL